MHDPLGPFTFKLFNREYTIHPRVDLDIDKVELEDQIMGQPGQFAFYGMLADEAENTVEAWQVELQQKESELYDRFVKEGIVKQTEDPMKKAVRGHSEYKYIQEQLVDASLIAKKLRTLVNAFVDRRFCLLALHGGYNKALFHESTLKSNPKPVAVAEHRNGVGAFPGKKRTK